MSELSIIKSKEENNVITINLNLERAKNMVEKINNLEKQLVHYKKMEKRWKRFGQIIRITNLTISGVIAGDVGVLAIITTQGVAIPPIVMALLGGYSAVETSVLEAMNIGIISKTKRKFSMKCQVIQDLINKVYFYYEKARQDGIITLEEIEEFNKLCNDFDRKISKIQFADTESDENIDLNRHLNIHGK